jgi:uncharacterized membrane protein YcjF (UPF0283 family)
MQIRIGNGGSKGSSGVAIHLGAGGLIKSATNSSNWMYTAAIAVLLVIGIVLVALVIREYRFQKKSKK